MPGGAFLDYDAVGIAKLLRTELLAVPQYQRSYSWLTREEEDQQDGRPAPRAQVVEYWEDLSRSFDQGKSYFLGTVVLSSDGAPSGRTVVIDGQQRLATTSLLLAGIRSAYQRRGQTQYADSIHRDYLGRFDRDAGMDQANFILSSDDRDFYQRLVLLREPAESNNVSQTLIKRSATYLDRAVDKLCDEAGTGWKARLDGLVRYLDEGAQVIVITVATEADAFLIFETLNDRGADLTVADLLKNFLFSQAGGRLDEVRDSWVITLSNRYTTGG